MKVEQKKIHLRDIKEGEANLLVKTLEVDGKKYYADRIRIDQLCTHRDCEACGEEFKKDYTFQKVCINCTRKRRVEEFNKLELVEWDTKSALILYGDDRFFFNIEEIEEYCEDNEIEASQLMFQLCEPTTFRPIDFDYWENDVHEDWEPNNEHLDLVDKLNKYLEKTPTGTWKPIKKRVKIEI